MTMFTLPPSSPWFSAAEHVCREEHMYPEHDRVIDTMRWSITPQQPKSVGVVTRRDKVLITNVKHHWKIGPATVRCQSVDAFEQYYPPESGLLFVKELIWIATNVVQYNLINDLSKLTDEDADISVSTNHLFELSGKFGNFQIQILGDQLVKGFPARDLDSVAIRAKIVTTNEEYPEGRFVRPGWMQLWQRQISGWSRGTGEPLQPYHRSNATYDAHYNWSQSAESVVTLEDGYATPILEDVFPVFSIEDEEDNLDHDKKSTLVLVLACTRESPLFVGYNKTQASESRYHRYVWTHLSDKDAV